MKRMLTLLVSMVSMTLNAAVTPEAEAVLQAFTEATGGREAKEGISTLVMQGHYEIPDQNIVAPILIQIKQPDKMAVRH
jgi:galactitol-specific phosphotransferase system IIC component